MRAIRVAVSVGFSAKEKQGFVAKSESKYETWTKVKMMISLLVLHLSL
jgi:hypothetical protein